MTQDKHNLIWIDLEMTGLDPVNDQIIEIATLITNSELEIVAAGPDLILHQPKATLDAMDDWNRRTHGDSGLASQVLASTLDCAQAATQTLAFIREHVPENTSPMCGNSICQDRRFLYRLMPDLERYFHYRNLDVSTLKELAYRWAPTIAQGVEKSSRHRAMDDIRDSIEELRYYRGFMGPLAGESSIHP